MEELRQLATTHPYWSLEEFAHVANQWLPRFLPEDRANTRVREEVNPRLIRQYTTSGLIDAPLKEGREARYTYRHLLQLLVARRLLAEGYATAVSHKLMAGQPDHGLEAMLALGALDAPAASPPNPAVAFLQGLTQRAPLEPPHVEAARMAPPPPAAAPAPAQKRSAAPRPAAPAPASPPSFEHDELFSLAVDEDFNVRPFQLPLAARRWTRLNVAPGLELHLRDDFRLPDTFAERQALMALIAELLDSHPSP